MSGTKKTNSALETQANTVTGETTANANTAARVGQLGEDLAISMITQKLLSGTNSIIASAGTAETAVEVALGVGQMANRKPGGDIAASNGEILFKADNIDLLATGQTTLVLAEASTRFVRIRAHVIITTLNLDSGTLTTDPIVGIGQTASWNEIVSGQTLTGITAQWDIFDLTLVSIASLDIGTNLIAFDVATAGVITGGLGSEALECSAILVGYTH